MATPAKSPGLLRSAFHFVASTPSLLTALIGGKIDDDNAEEEYTNVPRSVSKSTTIIPVTPGTSKKGVHFRENENQVREVERWIQPSDIFDSNEDSTDHDSPDMDSITLHHGGSTQKSEHTDTHSPHHVPLDTLALVHLHNKEHHLPVLSTSTTADEKKSNTTNTKTNTNRSAAIRKLNLEDIDNNENNNDTITNTTNTTTISSTINEPKEEKPTTTSSKGKGKNNKTLPPPPPPPVVETNTRSSRSNSSTTSSRNSDSDTSATSTNGVSTRRSRRLGGTDSVTSTGSVASTTTADSSVTSTTSTSSKGKKEVTKKGKAANTTTNNTSSITTTTLSSTAQRAEARRRKRGELDDDNDGTITPVITPVEEIKPVIRRGRGGKPSVPITTTTTTTDTKNTKASITTTTKDDVIPFTNDDSNMGFIERDVKREHHEPITNMDFISPRKQRKLSPTVTTSGNGEEQVNTNTNTPKAIVPSSVAKVASTIKSTPNISIPVTSSTSKNSLPIVSTTSPLHFDTTNNSNNRLVDSIMNDILPSTNSLNDADMVESTTTTTTISSTNSSSPPALVSSSGNASNSKSIITPPAISPQSTLPSLTFSFNSLPKSTNGKGNLLTNKPSSASRTSPSSSSSVHITSTPLKFSFHQLRPVSPTLSNNNTEEVVDLVEDTKTPPPPSTVTGSTRKFTPVASTNLSSSTPSVPPWITAAKESFSYNEQTSRELLLYLRKYRKYYHDNVTSQTNSLSILLRPANQPSLRSIPYDGSAFRVVRPLNSFTTTPAVVSSTSPTVIPVTSSSTPLLTNTTSNFSASSSNIMGYSNLRPSTTTTSISPPSTNVSPNLYTTNNINSTNNMLLTNTPYMHNVNTDNYDTDLTADMLNTSRVAPKSATSQYDRRSSLTTSTSALSTYRRRQSLTNPTGTMVGINPRTFGTPGTNSMINTNIPSTTGIQPHISSLTDMSMTNSLIGNPSASSVNISRLMNTSSASNINLRGSVLASQQRRVSINNTSMLMNNRTPNQLSSSLPSMNTPLLPAPPPENPEDIASRILGALGQLSNSTSKPIMNTKPMNLPIPTVSDVQMDTGTPNIANKFSTSTIPSSMNKNVAKPNISHTPVTQATPVLSTVLTENTNANNTPAVVIPSTNAGASSLSFSAKKAIHTPSIPESTMTKSTVGIPESSKKPLASSTITAPSQSLASSVIMQDDSNFSFGGRDHLIPSVTIADDELLRLIQETSGDFNMF